MSAGLGAVVLTVALQSAGAPGALAALGSAPEVSETLPVAFASELAPSLQLVFHHQRYWSPAHSFPADDRGAARLGLYAPTYLRGLQLRPLLDMQVDVAEYLFHALLTARLERLPRSGVGTPGALLEARASELLTGVPEGYRREAYLDSLASFGSHALSTALEIERKRRQRAARGDSLCRALRVRAPLFRLWEAIFRYEAYRGAYFVPADAALDAPGEVRYAPQGLEPDDKRWLIEQLLEERWIGDPEVDFGPLLCGGG